MSHWVTLVAGCSDYSFLPPAERKTEMTLKFLCFNARRASFYKSVMNVAASQRWYRIGPWCNATWKHSASGEVSDHFTGKHFAVSLQGMINFKETSDCSRVNERMEKVGFFHVFSLSALNQDWKNAMKIYPFSFARNLLLLVIYSGCTGLWDSSSSQVSSFWSERVNNSPKRSDREEPCSSYQTRHGSLNMKPSLKKHVFEDLRLILHSMMSFCADREETLAFG